MIATWARHLREFSSTLVRDVYDNRQTNTSLYDISTIYVRHPYDKRILLHENIRVKGEIRRHVAICVRVMHDLWRVIHENCTNWGWQVTNLGVIHWTVLIWEKGRYLNQSHDKSPYIIEIKKSRDNIKTPQNCDYTMIADRLRTDSSSTFCHPTGVVKPVYQILTSQLIAKSVYSKGHT